MRTFTYLMASSTKFFAANAAFSTSAAATTSQFGPGAQGGPVPLRYPMAFSIQGNFGGNGNASSGLYGGIFNLLASDVNEKSMFVVAASALVSSTGSVLFNATRTAYSYVDFSFLPNVTSTSGFLTVYLRVLEDGI